MWYLHIPGRRVLNSEDRGSNLSLKIPSNTILGDLTEDPGLLFNKVSMMHAHMIHILTNIHFHEVLLMNSQPLLKFAKMAHKAVAIMFSLLWM
jgi:hypothetical protein